jgi:hypothetical protein
VGRDNTINLPRSSSEVLRQDGDDLGWGGGLYSLWGIDDDLVGGVEGGREEEEGVDEGGKGRRIEMRRDSGEGRFIEMEEWKSARKCCAVIVLKR